MKRKYILLLVSVVAVFAGVYAYTEYNRKHVDLNSVKPKESITVADLLQLFIKDELSANEKFLGKIIEVQGEIRDVTIDDKGYLTLVLGEASNAMYAVRCSMDSVQNKSNRELVKGMVISVKGNFTGFKADDTGLLGSDVEMNRCVVSNN